MGLHYYVYYALCILCIYIFTIKYKEIEIHFYFLIRKTYIEAYIRKNIFKKKKYIYVLWINVT